MTTKKDGRDAEGRPLPVVGDAVVFNGDKYRIRELVQRPTYHGDRVVAELIVAPAGPGWRTTLAHSHRGAMLVWDARPGVWRVAPEPEPEPAAV